MNHKLSNACSTSRLQCSYCLCGTVTGTDGGPVSGIPVHFNMDCCTCDIVCTDENGRYCLSVTAFSTVTIFLETGLGVTVTPPCYHICSVRSDHCDLDFVLSPLVP